MASRPPDVFPLSLEGLSGGEEFGRGVGNGIDSNAKIFSNLL